jgi:hypothetical protein
LSISPWGSADLRLAALPMAERCSFLSYETVDEILEQPNFIPHNSACAMIPRGSAAPHGGRFRPRGKPESSKEESQGRDSGSSSANSQRLFDRFEAL